MIKLHIDTDIDSEYLKSINISISLIRPARAIKIANQSALRNVKNIFFKKHTICMSGIYHFIFIIIIDIAIDIEKSLKIKF